jgi:hypothetical protein
VGSDDSLIDFATLLVAQALGDRDALTAAARHVTAFDLGPSPNRAIADLLEDV